MFHLNNYQKVLERNILHLQGFIIWGTWWWRSYEIFLSEVKAIFLKNWFAKDTTAFQISHQFYIPWH